MKMIHKYDLAPYKALKEELQVSFMKTPTQIQVCERKKGEREE